MNNVNGKILKPMKSQKLSFGTENQCGTIQTQQVRQNMTTLKDLSKGSFKHMLNTKLPEQDIISLLSTRADGDQSGENNQMCRLSLRNRQ